ncbi:MAG: hypothetical protein ACPHY8_04460 [Patescibacteria group bacterium]
MVSKLLSYAVGEVRNNEFVVKFSLAHALGNKPDTDDILTSFISGGFDQFKTSTHW